MSDSLTLDSLSDLHVNQERTCIHFYDGVHASYEAEPGKSLACDDDGYKILLQYIQGALLSGQKEFFRISLRATFDLDLDIMGIIQCKNIRCGKTIAIGESEKLKAAFRKKLSQRWEMWITAHDYLENHCLPILFGKFSNSNWLDYYHKMNAMKLLQAAENDKVDVQLEDLSNHNDISIDSKESFDTSLCSPESSLLINYANTNGNRKPRKFLILPDIPLIQLPTNPFTRNLLPNPSFQISLNPGIITTIVTCEIYFSRNPGMNFSTGLVEFDSTLNGQTVAHISIDPFSFGERGRKSQVKVSITPIAASRPVSGSISTIRSFIRGAMAGVASGLLYQDWGASSTLVGCKNFKFHDSDGVLIEWVTNIVEGIDEIDIPLFSKVLRAVIEGRNLEAKDFMV